jgi:hypothetical protein
MSDGCETGTQCQDNGRIHDHELVEAVQRIAGNGTGDTRWKVPGVDLHRFCSGQVLMLGGLLFEGDG